MAADLAGAKALRVGFAGTPEFAAVALQAIHAAGCTVPLVLTQPDRPAGRGMKLQPSAVKQLALALDIPVAQPRSLRLDGKFPDEAEAGRAALEAARLDVLVVAAYGLILPEWVLALPRLGCLNSHGSLLPRRSTARSRPATSAPASPSCRWTPGWTPATCCWSRTTRSPSTTPPARCTTGWLQWAAG